jgi:hypothetical protein
LISPAVPNSFISGWKSAIRKIAAMEHSTIDSLRIETSTFPAEHSYHYSYVQVDSEGMKRYVFGYAMLIHSGVLQVEQSGPWDSETAIFTRLVGTFAPTDS